ncbi:MAG: hypothetical protein ACYC8T_20825 [Myxococcaceae bacterium]
MRLLGLILVLLAGAAFGQENVVEVFADRGDVFMKAGSKSGLAVGNNVTIYGDKIGDTSERRRIGTATVMEVWDTLARINLDGAAKADGAAAKFAAAGQAKPAAQAAAAKASGGKAEGALRGYVTFKGFARWKILKLYNQTGFDWTGCTLRMNDGRSYKLAKLKKNDAESIANSNFVAPGPEKDSDPTSVQVTCTEGSARFAFVND